MIASAVMKVAVVKETDPVEHRVALVPDVVRRLVGAGLEVAVEAGAGVRAHRPDEEYRDAGAEITANPLDGADVVLSVQPISAAQVRDLRVDAKARGEGEIRRVGLAICLFTFASSRVRPPPKSV